MEKYFGVIEKSPLFLGLAQAEIGAILRCLSSEVFTFARHEFILRLGDSVHSIAMVLSGSVHIIKEDFWGNRNILAEIPPGQLFAESYACTQGATLEVSALASEACQVMMLDARRITTSCSSACAFHARLIQNLLSTLAEKNLRLNEKLTHITKRSTREKLLSYLSAESLHRGSSSFEIPFNRQQLADYLSIDRSAMSAELGKMRDEGLISFAKNRFTLNSASPG